MHATSVVLHVLQHVQTIAPSTVKLRTMLIVVETSSFHSHHDSLGIATLVSYDTDKACGQSTKLLSYDTLCAPSTVVAQHCLDKNNHVVESME